MPKSEIIVRVGGEGGDLTLYGARTEDGWLFSREVVDQAPVFLNEGDEIRHSSTQTTTWSGALALLNKYPWQNLYPLEVHSEFRERVLTAVKEFFQKEDGANRRRLQNWVEICSINGCDY